MYQSKPVTVIYYRLYWFRWYIRHHEYFTNHSIMDCRFWPEIREINQDGALGKMWPVRPLQVKVFLKKHQVCVWYQDKISLAYNRLDGMFQFGTTGWKNWNILISLNRSSEGGWKKKYRRRESTLHIIKKRCHWCGNSISVCTFGSAYCILKPMKKLLIYNFTS